MLNLKSNKNKRISSNNSNRKSNLTPNFLSRYDEGLPHKISISLPEDNPMPNICRNRVIGSMIGLAIGDAMGASVEFRSHAYLINHPVTNMQSGGTWNLQKGQWTDDTSMSLCLASSLITQGGFNIYDQFVRYKWWFKHGFLSSTGHCFDIGTSTRRALEEFSRRQKLIKNHFHLKTEYDTDRIEFDRVKDVPGFNLNVASATAAGNGALMRLAPVPLFYFRSPIDAIEYAGRSAAVTHGDKRAIDACRFYAALIVAIMHDEPKESLLSDRFYEDHQTWFGATELHPEILRVAHGSYKQSGGYKDGIRGTGYVVSSLEAALWAFCYDQNSYEIGVCAVIALGDDTDSTAAIYGQLAGAYYGYENIPEKWRRHIYAHELIVRLGHWLDFLGHQLSTCEESIVQHDEPLARKQDLYECNKDMTSELSNDESKTNSDETKLREND